MAWLSRQRLRAVTGLVILCVTFATFILCMPSDSIAPERQRRVARGVHHDASAQRARALDRHLQAAARARPPRMVRSFSIPVRHPVRQHNMTVTGVVFYGRRSRVKTLSCYLERNLAVNGGLLSTVVFVVATNEAEDVRWLEALVAKHRGYFKIHYPVRLDVGYTGHYAWLKPDEYYVKIDDDVMYIKDDALDLMLQAYYAGDFFIVSANVINHQPLMWAHVNKGAAMQIKRRSPSSKHWDVQPGTKFEDNGWDCWGNWECAAAAHYSFLHNFRHNNLSLYEFPGGQHRFDFNKHYGYTRWRINMILFKGSDIDIHVYNMSATTGTYAGDDEEQITRVIPQTLKRHSAAVSEALAVHFSYFRQREGLENNTDLLDQYALLARQHCGKVPPNNMDSTGQSQLQRPAVVLPQQAQQRAQPQVQPQAQQRVRGTQQKAAQ